LLGILLDQKLGFQKHARKAAQRGEKAAMALQRIRGLGPKSARQIFTATVTPTTDYGAPIWFPRASGVMTHMIERATKLGASTVTGIFRSAAYEVAVAEAGVETVQDRLYELVRRHWIKMHTIPANHQGWKLLDRLFRTKTHLSPLEATGRLFQVLARTTGKNGSIR
jgi:hypothetical protein